MAEVQLSEPQLGDPFTDRGWRAGHAGQTGILDDLDGSAFGLTKPAVGNVVEIGSTTLPSRLAVDGYGLEIAKNTTQSLTIPASTGGATGRTDLIVARLNLSAFTGDPGPVRMQRIAGTEGSTALPAATYDPVGVQDLVLYSIRRIQGEGLNQAIVVDRRPRTGRHYLVPDDGVLPQNAPLGSRATRADVVWRRDKVGSSVDWVEESRPAVTLVGAGNTTAGVEPGWQRSNDSQLVTDKRWRNLHLILKRTGARIASASGVRKVATVNDEDRPPVGVHVTFTARIRDEAGGSHPASGYIADDGSIYLMWVVSGVYIGPDSPDDTLTIDATWWARS